MSAVTLLGGLVLAALLGLGVKHLIDILSRKIRRRK